jgi:hypothetical protein
MVMPVMMTPRATVPAVVVTPASMHLDDIRRGLRIDLRCRGRCRERSGRCRRRRDKCAERKRCDGCEYETTGHEFLLDCKAVSGSEFLSACVNES